MTILIAPHYIHSTVWIKVGDEYFRISGKTKIGIHPVYGQEKDTVIMVKGTGHAHVLSKIGKKWVYEPSLEMKENG